MWLRLSAECFGWLAGPNAKEHENSDNEVLRILGLRSIASVFKMDPKTIEKELLSGKVANWLADPFSRGAYAYATLKTPEARRELNRPEEDTLFFAGEAISEGSEIGTVEAAFASGIETARKILRS